MEIGQRKEYGSMDDSGLCEVPAQEDTELLASCDSRTSKDERRTNKGLSVIAAAVFIAGEMAGSGVLALPKAVVDTGWMGLPLIIYFCFNAGVGGTCLGACWSMIEERMPERRAPVRNPYSTIALVACGRKTSLFVSGCILITLFGAGTVYLLLASQIVQEIFQHVPGIAFCEWFAIIALFVSPVMWLGSPKDFSIVGIGAIVTTAVACVLLFVQMVTEYDKIYPAQHEVPTFRSVFLAFGTILFSFGGASTFPTIQNDMKERHKFSNSVLIGFAVILLLYLPVSAGGYFIYGQDVQSNVIINMNDSPLVFIANVLLALHLILAFLIVVNPVCQELEERLKIPKYFHWKRCLLRILLLCVMVFIGESIPDFGKILSLIGGSTITFTTFIFPAYFYMKLCDKSSQDWPRRYMPRYRRVYMWGMILIGIVGGAASTYNALGSIFGGYSFTMPCYINIFMKQRESA